MQPEGKGRALLFAGACINEGIGKLPPPIFLLRSFATPTALPKKVPEAVEPNPLYRVDCPRAVFGNSQGRFLSFVDCGAPPGRRLLFWVRSAGCAEE